MNGGINKIMSKKSFILTALVINLTICITLCLVSYTEKDSKSTEVNEVTKELASDEVENSWDTTSPDEEKDKETSSDKDESITVEEKTSTEDNTSKQEESSTTKESETESQSVPTSFNLSLEPEENTQPEETVAVNGTTAVIKNSCNIHEIADVGHNIGVANAGTSYKIDKAKCTENWIAIILQDGSTGYVAASYCTIS